MNRELIELYESMKSHRIFSNVMTISCIFLVMFATLWVLYTDLTWKAGTPLLGIYLVYSLLPLNFLSILVALSLQFYLEIHRLNIKIKREMVK